MEELDIERLVRKGVKGLFFVQPSLRNLKIHSASCSCITELLNYARSGTVPELGFFEGFSLHTINSAGRISEAASDGAGARKRPILRNNEPKDECAQRTGFQRGQNLLG
jgi:hypothetical protein